MIDLAQHHHHMRTCLQLAEVARENGNTGVGSLIVKAGQVIATASEEVTAQLDVTGHAELLAIRKACQALSSLDLSQCMLYTTAEPCWMCSYAIRETGIKTVIIGAGTPVVGGLNAKYPLLRDDSIAGWPEPPTIVTGILEEECAAIR